MSVRTGLLTAIALVILRQSGPLKAVEFSQGELEGKRFTVCKVDVQREQLHLFLRDQVGKPLRSFEGLLAFLKPSGRTLSFAMNAGMYHGDLSPVGLFAEDGRQLAPLNLSAGTGNFFLKPNGVFLLTQRGAQVLESSEVLKVREKIRLATQSGPLLVRAGKIHPAFKPDSEFRLIRNGVGVPAPGTALFVETDSVVNLHEMARIFRDVLHCPDALYFDGTVSSLYAPALGRSEKRIDLGPIIGVTENPEVR